MYSRKHLNFDTKGIYKLAENPHGHTPEKEKHILIKSQEMDSFTRVQILGEVLCISSLKEGLYISVIRQGIVK